MESQPLKEKGLVQEVFEKPSSSKKRVSALFTQSPSAGGKRSSRERRPPKGEEFPPGLEISSKGVKLFQLGRSQGGSLELKKLDIIDYPSSIPEALKLMVRRHRLKGGVVISIPDSLIQIYNFKFPPMGEEELLRAIELKLEQLKSVRLKGEEIQFGYLKTSSHVLVAVIPGAKLAEIKRLCQKTGLNPLAVEFGPASLIRLEKFGLAALPSKKIKLWLNLAEVITLAASRDGEIIFAATLSLTPPALEEALGMEGPSTAAVLENLAIEIEHSVKSLAADSMMGEEINYDRIFLSGARGNLRKLEAFLNSKLGQPVEIIDPFKFFNLSSQLSSESRPLLLRGAEFPLAAALATRGLDNISSRLDLLSFRRQKKGLTLTAVLQEKFVWASLGIILLIMAGISYPLLRTYYLNQRQIRLLSDKGSQAKLELTRLQTSELSVSEKLSALARKKEELEERLKVLKESLRQPREFSQALVDISSLLPEDIRVTRLGYKSKKFIIVGQAREIKPVVDFIERLNASNKFARPAFNYTEKKMEEGASVYDFEVTAEAR